MRNKCGEFLEDPLEGSWYTQRNLIKSNSNQIVFTIFLFDLESGKKIWFLFDLIWFRKKIAVCRMPKKCYYGKWRTGFRTTNVTERVVWREISYYNTYSYALYAFNYSYIQNICIQNLSRCTSRLTFRSLKKITIIIYLLTTLINYYYWIITIIITNQ